ncbi:MAG TPA: phosphoglycerate kinase [Candidatus Woesebacteria bacterium]|nr:phosphoglycerate kinase [Candidatus Woesebacteria bacterium]HRT40023.1 phosphoglycerate kinase [Candidatus Woesebacteria bacterium]
MNLRSVEQYLPAVGSLAILRMDLDVPEGDNSRLKKSVPTLRYLLDQGSRVAIIGHKGRPKGIEEKYSLRKVYLDLMGILGNQADLDSVFMENFNEIKNNQILFFENLRFWPEEEANNDSFMKNLIDHSRAYINDAFAVAHRRHASIMLHQKMDGYYGFAFIEEVEKISHILENPARPLTIILGGAKEDKLSYLPDLVKIADKILIGGKLPQITNYELPITNEKINWGKLRRDTLDLSQETINQFIEIINNSKTIIWAGAMGYYENENSRWGTQKIAEAVALNPGFKIIAGGETAASVIDLKLKDKIDYICSGGGVMLEFLTKGTLPAWEERS